YFRQFFPISEYSARRLQEVIALAPERVAVTGVGIRPAFAREIAGQRADSPFGHLAQPPGYFLMVGGADRRKNAELVVQAFARIATGAGMTPGLVVVGNYPQDYRDGLATLYRAAGGREGNLHFLSGISDADLGELYRQAIATVCPSQIEGFSVPVVEAIACGSPVLASDIDAHRELIMQPEARFDPESSEALAALLVRVAADPALRERLAAEQHPVAARFTEDAVVGRFWQPVFAEFDRRYRTASAGRRG